MKKMFDFKCNPCDLQVEVYTDKKTEKCGECGKRMWKVPGFGGYHIGGNNGASVRPRNAGYSNRLDPRLAENKTKKVTKNSGSSKKGKTKK